MASLVSFNSLVFFALAITISIFCLSIFTSVDASKGGFSVELIHRDSPKSPFYNSQQTPSQRLANAFRRSVTRLQHFYPTKYISPNSPKSTIYANRGEYIMKFSIGSPPFEILSIADTGSDLLWTQCGPCEQCYEQEDPLFNSSSSTTYRDLSCSASACESLDDRTSCSSANKCTYQYSYGDQSYSIGNLAADTVTLGSTNGRPVSFPGIIFGCGRNNGGTFNEKGSGIVGLGGGSISLITQLDSAINGKFSYCLVPLNTRSGNSSALNFGSNAVVSGAGAVSTPLYSGDQSTFYYLQLEAVSVGSTRIEYSSTGTSEGNIIIDSGTTLTLLPEDFYLELESAVDNAIGGEKIDDPNGQLQLCYDANSNLNFPTITVHFEGANLKLNPVNTFIQITSGVVCFTFVPSQISGIDGIFGNLAQANFLVGYDLKGKTVSFKPTNCAGA